MGECVFLECSRWSNALWIEGLTRCHSPCFCSIAFPCISSLSRYLIKLGSSCRLSRRVTFNRFIFRPQPFPVWLPAARKECDGHWLSSKRTENWEDNIVKNARPKNPQLTHWRWCSRLVITFNFMSKASQHLCPLFRHQFVHLAFDTFNYIVHHQFQFPPHWG